MKTEFGELLRRLAVHEVEFILIGGLAGNAHGAARNTLDVDVVYGRSDANIARAVAALADTEPYLRGAPPGLPFSWDADTLRQGLNFTLTTTMGHIDLLGEIAGGGGYSDLLPHTIEIEVFEVSCLCLDLEKLIEVKRAAGRPKDLEVVAELEAIWEEREKLE